MHNIPLGMMNKAYGEKLGKAITEVLDIDIGKNGVGGGPFNRIKVWVNITKPLSCGSLINPTGNPLCSSFKYE